MNIKSLLLPIAISVLFLLPSCKDEFNRRHTSHLGELTLKVSPSIRLFVDRSATRAALNEGEESEINDVYCLIFGSDGDLLSRIKQDEIKGANPFDVSVPAMGYFRVVLLANVQGRSTGTAGLDLEAALDAIASEDELGDLYFSLREKTIFPDAGFLMRGSTVANCETRENISADGVIEVSLVRMMSKIRFDIGYTEVENDNTNGYRIERHILPKKWQVFNLPSAVQIQAGGGRQKGYFDSDEYQFEDEGYSFVFYSLPNTKTGVSAPPDYKRRELQVKTPDAQNPGYVENGAFVHAPQNSTYVVMEMEYVEKHYDMSNNLIRTITAPNARYVIHLGGVGGDANNWEVKEGVYYKYNIRVKGVNEIISEVEAYDAIDAEKNTGYEGDVMDARFDEVFDANYETTVIHIKNSDVGTNPICYAFTPYCQGDDTDIDWVEFSVNDHASYTLKDYAKAKTAANPLQRILKPKQFMEWLKDGRLFGGRDEIYVSVYINEFYYETRPATYTGPIEDDDDWAQRGWTTFVNQPDRVFVMHLSNNDPTFSGRRYSYDRKSSYDAPILVVRQKAIYTPYTFDIAGQHDPSFLPNPKDQRAIAFGMEVIENEPVDTQCEAPLASGGYDGHKGELWKGRENSFYMLWNIHNRHISWLGKLKPPIGQMPWKNVVGIEGKKYTVDKMYDGWARSFQAQYACWTKNRDSDGDGLISPHEAKWYLPATEEIAILGIAEPAIPFEYRLSIPEPIRSFRHYMTSTRAGFFKLNNITYYAEVGLKLNEQIYDPQLRAEKSWGNQYILYDYVPFDKKGTYYYSIGSTNKFSYRCLRQLGVKPSYIDHIQGFSGNTPPMPRATRIWSYTGDGENEPYCIHLRYLDPKALRPSSMRVRGELPAHTKNSVWNRPMKDFYVAKQTISDIKGVGYDGQGMFYQEVLDTKPCENYREMAGGREDGWRLPNATELYIMQSALVSKDANGNPVQKPLNEYEDHKLGWKNVWNEYNNNPSAGVQAWKGYFASTEFDGGPGVFYRYALIKNIFIPSLSLVRSNNIKCYVRCVKDAPQ